MMAYGGRKEIGNIVRQLEKQGWTVTSNKGHLKMRSPSGQVVHSGTTPSEYRGIRNLKAQLRRAGATLK